MQAMSSRGQQAMNVSLPGSNGGKERQSPPQVSMATTLRIRKSSRVLSTPNSSLGKDKLSQSLLDSKSSTASSSASSCQGLKDILLSPISILLLCFPAGLAAFYQTWGDSYVFWLMFAAMIPLAKILGDATEELAANLKNDMISGLLNATFGNAVEMIMTVALLAKHEYLVVKTTLIGSVLSNMLLVLGMSFFAGGVTKSKNKTSVQNKEQHYNQMGALMNVVSLLLACMTLALVTVFNQVDGLDDGDEPVREAQKFMLPISRIAASLIILSYVAFIVFQLFTHKDALADTGEEGTEEEEEEEPNLTLSCSITLLIVATVVVAVASEYLTGALEGALDGAGMGKAFVGVILLPIVGNACEHAAAIRFAIADKASLSVGIAVGSSVQIALFVAPLSVLMGWALGDSEAGLNMDLDFGGLNVTVMTMSVIIILAIVVDGKSNWFEGWLLMTAYAIVAILYWYLPDAPEVALTVTSPSETALLL